MSSLRLALKQSLQETGHLAPDGDKKKRKKGRRNSIDSIKNKRGRRPGDAPRGNKSKRGRPRRPLSPDREGGRGEGRSHGNSEEGKERLSATGERQGSSFAARHPEDYSSSENEFSYEDDGEDDSHGDEGEDDDEEGDRRGHDDDEDDDDDVEDEDDDMHSDEEDHEHGGHHRKVDLVERPRHATTADSDLAVSAPAAASTTSPQSKGHATSDRSAVTSAELESSSPREPPHGPRTKGVKVQGQEDINSDEELRKKRKLLKKKLKHSAAHKIQNQWKKKKHDSSTSEGHIPREQDRPRSSMNDVSPTGRDSHESKPSIMVSVKEASPPSRASRANDRDDDESADEPDEPVIKKKAKKKGDGVVPAPTADVLEWTRAMSEKKCRKSVATGLRVKVSVADDAPLQMMVAVDSSFLVPPSHSRILSSLCCQKVRFATRVKREGKMVKKKIWYGGRVTAVSKMGSKIKIKYDDGTSEISKFPDKDVVVDAVMNGEHSVPADRFIPPQHEDDGDEHEGRSVESEVPTELEMSQEHNAKMDAPEPEPEPTKVESPTDANDGETVGPVTTSGTDLKGDQAQPPSIAPMDFQTTAQPESLPSSHSNPPIVADAASPPGESGVVPISETNVKLVETSEMEVMSTIPLDLSTPPKVSLSIDEGPAFANISRKSPEPAVKPEEPLAVRSVPLPASPEEGELSPGITVQKQCIPDQPELEASPLPQTSSSDQEPQCELPSESKTELDTSTEGAGRVSKESVSTSTPVQHLQESEAPSEDAPSIAAPKPKLAIRLTNLGGQAGLSSFRATPPLEMEVSVDEILVDTLVPEEMSKRKRTLHADGDDEEAPPKRRIRVSLGKLEEKASKDPVRVLSEESKSETMEKDQSSSPDKDGLTNSTKSANTVEEASGETSETIENKPTPPAVEKKKKKKADRQKSPKPSIPKQTASPGVMSDHLIESQRADSDINVAKLNSSQTEETLDQRDLPGLLTSAPKPHVDSKSSALSGGKKSSQLGKGSPDDAGNTPKQTTLKSHSSMESFASSAPSRTGRKAAQEAKGKLTIKEKDNEPPLESGKKKNKRKRNDDAEVDVGGESDVSNETEWVQCDSCGKWRILPDDVKVSSLPNKWYCHMNVYDPKRSSCTAPEQSPKQALKERKKARKRAKRMEQVEVESTQEDLKKEKLLATPVNSPKPAKVVKSGVKVKENVEPKKVVPALAEDQSHPSDSGSETQKEDRKKGKKIRVPDASLPAEVSDAAADGKKPGRKRGRPARSQTTTTPLSAQESRDEDNVEWVQCEKCEKWRKLPPDISADELPDTWYCSMNTWNPASASCQAAEDQADSQHHEIGTSEWQLRQSHAGKYSYRQMIFGTGAKKHNRPMSERSRAAESLFMRQTEDDENPHPSVMYSKSSCFLPRTSNFNKTNALEDNTLGIFDVLSNSNLWAELRRMDATPTKVESNGGGQSYPKFATYENLPDDIKNAMHEVVLNILGASSLTGDDVIGECQRYPWDASTSDVADIRGYCNTDVIINTLLALVRDGIVEMTYLSDPNVPISQWVPKYRRVRSRRALEAVEAIKASRCMKIAKPWKQREEKRADWITGKGAFY